MNSASVKRKRASPPRKKKGQRFHSPRVVRRKTGANNTSIDPAVISRLKKATAYTLYLTEEQCMLFVSMSPEALTDLLMQHNFEVGAVTLQEMISNAFTLLPCCDTYASHEHAKRLAHLSHILSNLRLRQTGQRGPELELGSPSLRSVFLRMSNNEAHKIITQYLKLEAAIVDVGKVSRDLIVAEAQDSEDVMFLEASLNDAAENVCQRRLDRLKVLMSPDEEKPQGPATTFEMDFESLVDGVTKACKECCGSDLDVTSIINRVGDTVEAWIAAQRAR